MPGNGNFISVLPRGRNDESFDDSSSVKVLESSFLGLSCFAHLSNSCNMAQSCGDSLWFILDDCLYSIRTPPKHMSMNILTPSIECIR